LHSFVQYERGGVRIVPEWATPGATADGKPAKKKKKSRKPSLDELDDEFDLGDDVNPEKKLNYDSFIAISRRWPRRKSPTRRPASSAPLSSRSSEALVPLGRIGGRVEGYPRP